MSNVNVDEIRNTIENLKEQIRIQRENLRIAGLGPCVLLDLTNGSPPRRMRKTPEGNLSVSPGHYPPESAKKLAQFIQENF